MGEVIDMKYSPEVQKRLQSLVGFSEDATFSYVCKAHRENLPKAEWPVFKLKGKTGIENAKVEDAAGFFDVKNQRMVFTTGTQRLETLACGVIGWNSKFVDRAGKAIPFEAKDGRVTDKCLGRIPPGLQVELQEAINEQAALAPEELQGLEF